MSKYALDEPHINSHGITRDVPMSLHSRFYAFTWGCPTGACFTRSCDVANTVESPKGLKFLFSTRKMCEPACRWVAAGMSFPSKQDPAKFFDRDEISITLGSIVNKAHYFTESSFCCNYSQHHVPCYLLHRCSASEPSFGHLAANGKRTSAFSREIHSLRAHHNCDGSCCH